MTDQQAMPKLVVVALCGDGQDWRPRFREQLAAAGVVVIDFSGDVWGLNRRMTELGRDVPHWDILVMVVLGDKPGNGIVWRVGAAGWFSKFRGERLLVHIDETPDESHATEIRLEWESARPALQRTLNEHELVSVVRVMPSLDAMLEELLRLVSELGSQR